MEKQTDKTADQPSTTAKIEATPSEPPKRVSVNPAVDLAGFTAAMAEACTPVPPRYFPALPRTTFAGRNLHGTAFETGTRTYRSLDPAPFRRHYEWRY